tara:strand:- start:653 stop:1567 length:915 start_codon:yes stop_codon:yes gene_type:complete
MEEIPIDAHLSGNIVTQKIELEQDYKNQVFYNLKNNSVVSQNIKTDWDLGFIINDNTDYIILNTSTFMQVAEVNTVGFEDLITINNLEWSWDHPSGIEYGTEISNEAISNNVYIIDRGYLLNGNKRGYKKLMIQEVNNDYYKIRYSNLDNSNDTVVQINKEGQTSFIAYSFDIDDKRSIFPESYEWDLVFTQYTAFFNDTTTPAYLVTGVMTNYLNNVLVALDTINDFEQINLSMINNYNFSNKQDEIGYNWKLYDLDNNLYIINNSLIYIIKDVEGRYFKLQFFDFYNDIGQKGYPQFKIQEL